MADQRVPVSPASIIEQRSYLSPGKLNVTEYLFKCFRDYHHLAAGTICVSAWTASRHERPLKESKSDGPNQPSYIVWLNGGPGQASRPPQDYAFTSPLLDKGYTVLVLDQRGTGLSTPITASTLKQQGDETAQLNYLKLHRADSIVRDCEAIRLALTATSSSEGEARAATAKWSLFGQSFGGFVSLSYLSFYPEGLKEAFLFGGLAPVAFDSPHEVYRRLYKTLQRRNTKYYCKFPEDVKKVRKVVAFLKGQDQGNSVSMPGGGKLTARRFMQLGIAFGYHGRFDTVHDIVRRSSLDIDTFGHLTRVTLGLIENFWSWDDCMLYSVLHEPIYCQGRAADWAAHELAESEFPQFGLKRLMNLADDQEPLLFTGEMIYPWMFEDCPELKLVQGVAEKIAAHADWTPLYDLKQLAENTVPVYAAVYTEDMYVDVELSRDTASRVKESKVFLTNVMYHNAIRDKCKEVVDQLFALRDDELD